MSRMASVEGTMRRVAGRAFSIPVRGAKDPALLSELSRKVRSHLSKRHRRWVHAYRECVVPPAEGLGLAIRRDPGAVQADAFLAAADRLSTAPIVIDKPFGARLNDRPEARVGLLRKSGRDIGA
jgi:hypothetical protein